MATGYKALTHSDSYCSLNSSLSSQDRAATETQTRVLEEGRRGVEEGRQQLLVKKPSVYVFKCRYCKGEFTSRQHGLDGHCIKAPNYARDNVDNLCIVQAFRGCWYHLTKDQIIDDNEVNVLRAEFPEAMNCSLWIKYILLSCLCFPCICLWLPFFMWERQTRTVFGPRHSIRRRRLVNKCSVSSEYDRKTSKTSTGNQREVRITIEELPPSPPEEPPPSSDTQRVTDSSDPPSPDSSDPPSPHSDPPSPHSDTHPDPPSPHSDTHRNPDPAVTDP